MVNTTLFLNMQILSDYLDDQFSDYIFYRSNDPMVLEDVRLYYGQTTVSQQMVYVTSPAYLDDLMKKNCNIILVGQAVICPDPIHYKKSIIHIPRKENPCLILELIQDIFLKFRKWSAHLEQILAGHGSMYDLCSASIEIFENPVYILDHNNNAIVRTAFVVGMMEMKMDPATGNLFLPVERRNLLYHSKEFLETYQTQTAQYWTPPWNKHRDIYINIFDENKRYQGRILINELQSSFKASHLKLLEYFSCFIKEAFLSCRSIEKPKDSPLQKLLYRYLFDEDISEEHLLEQLDRIGWHQEDGYLTAKASLPHLDSSYAYSACLDITENINDCVAFFRETELYAVCHVPRSVHDPAPCYSLLHEIGLKGSIHFGASNLFYNILKLPNYSKQAQAGLEYGLWLHPDQYCHPFSGIALSYMLKNSVGDLNSNMVCASSIRLLEKIDLEKGSDYFKTLKEYIRSNCQPVLAAKALFLHRGTLTYRLNKIQELTNLDLDDRDTILYLDLSFRIRDLFRQEASDWSPRTTAARKPES